MKAPAQHQTQANASTHAQPSAPVFQTFSATAEQDVESWPASRMSASALFGSYLQRQAMNARFGFDSNLHANHANYASYSNPSSLMAQPVQRRMAAYHENQEALGSAQFNTSRINNTGLPDNLKAGIEGLSGYSMDDVNVHYNSAKPAQLYAHAYTLGSDIHIAPGQEQYLPHEAWHVVQQKQGRVRPTMQLKGVGINDNVGLEREASVMGAQALQGGMLGNREQVLTQQAPRPAVQRVIWVPMNQKQNIIYEINNIYESINSDNELENLWQYIINMNDSSKDFIFNSVNALINRMPMLLEEESLKLNEEERRQAPTSLQSLINKLKNDRENRPTGISRIPEQDGPFSPAPSPNTGGGGRLSAVSVVPFSENRLANTRENGTQNGMQNGENEYFYSHIDFGGGVCGFFCKALWTSFNRAALGTLELMAFGATVNRSGNFWVGGLAGVGVAFAGDFFANDNVFFRENSEELNKFKGSKFIIQLAVIKLAKYFVIFCIAGLLEVNQDSWEQDKKYNDYILYSTKYKDGSFNSFYVKRFEEMLYGTGLGFLSAVFEIGLVSALYWSSYCKYNGDNTAKRNKKSPIKKLPSKIPPAMDGLRKKTVGLEKKQKLKSNQLIKDEEVRGASENKKNNNTHYGNIELGGFYSTAQANISTNLPGNQRIGENAHSSESEEEKKMQEIQEESSAFESFISNRIRLMSQGFHESGKVRDEEKSQESIDNLRRLSKKKSKKSSRSSKEDKPEISVTNLSDKAVDKKKNRKTRCLLFC